MEENENSLFVQDLFLIFCYNDRVQKGVMQWFLTKKHYAISFW